MKLYAWEESFLSDINSKRAKELRYLLLSGLLRAVLTLIFNTLPVMVGIRELQRLTCQVNAPGGRVKLAAIVLVTGQTLTRPQSSLFGSHAEEGTREA